MERFENIWISSEDHLKIYQEIKGQKHILKNVLDPNIGEKYYDFPRIFVSMDSFPVIFNNIGRLIISDDNIQFYVSSIDNNQYRGINKGDNVFISYSQITNIELISYRMAFIRYFDNLWIKISYVDNGNSKHLLVSNSGKGFAMKKIKRENTELLNLIKSKKNNAAQHLASQ